LSSYLGGSKDDRATNLVLSEDGAVYVLGYTNSDDFLTLEKLLCQERDRMFSSRSFRLEWLQGIPGKTLRRRSNENIVYEYWIVGYA
jgi:hypothetical protein